MQPNEAQSDATAQAARKRRHRLYLIGTAFAFAGMALGTMPVFTERTPILMAKGVATFGALILAIGRFAPDHFLRRFFPQHRS
jgi:hypothetical protein